MKVTLQRAQMQMGGEAQRQRIETIIMEGLSVKVEEIFVSGDVCVFTVGFVLFCFSSSLSSSALYPFLHRLPLLLENEERGIFQD